MIQFYFVSGQDGEPPLGEPLRDPALTKLAFVKFFNERVHNKTRQAHPNFPNSATNFFSFAPQ